MPRWLAFAAAIVVAAAALATGPAALASQPQPVTITVLTTIAPNSVDRFAATGGVVCSSRTVSTPLTLFVGFQSNAHAQILVLKRFVCATGVYTGSMAIN